MAARKQFRREFKLEAVRLVEKRGVSVRQAAQGLDVHENVLRKWSMTSQLVVDAPMMGVGVGVDVAVSLLRCCITRTGQPIHQRAFSATAQGTGHYLRHGACRRSLGQLGNG